MTRRYQVFISSTYSNLKDERQAVMRTVLELQCIPAGMELFPASNLGLLNLIYGIIDNSDFYIVLLSNRYGSIESSSGKSFTQLEYEYALNKGVNILRFVHNDLHQMVFEDDRDKQLSFVKEVENPSGIATNCPRWKNVDELARLVSISLGNETRSNPPGGWIKDGTAKSIIELETRIRELESQLAVFTNNFNPAIATLELDMIFQMSFTVASTNIHNYFEYGDSEEVKIKWQELFTNIISVFLHPATPEAVGERLRDYLSSKIKKCPASNQKFIKYKVDLDGYDRVVALLIQYGVIESEGNHFVLTPSGKKLVTSTILEKGRSELDRFLNPI